MIIPAANRLQKVQEYYFSKKLKEIKKLNDQGAKIINLGIGSPDLPPSKATISALTQTAIEPSNHGYQSYIGTPELRHAIATWVNKTYGYQLDELNEILPMMGSKEGIMHISMAFLNKGDKVLVPNPGYPTYSSVSELLEAEIVTYNLEEKLNWNIDIDHLKSLDLDQVKLMWINFPNMPTGAAPDTKILSELIELAKKHQFLIINDNPYSLILADDHFSIFQLDGAEEVCLELNSLSKSHNMAGWRVGWLSGKAEYVSTVLKVKSNMDSGMFLGIQNAAVQAFENSLKWHQDQNAIYQERKNMICKIFDFLEVKYDTNASGLFIWGKVPNHVSSTEEMVDEILYQAGVFITPGFIFGSKGDRYIRASLCANENNIQTAFERIKNAKLKLQ